MTQIPNTLPTKHFIFFKTNVSASFQSLTITFWGIFELIIKESAGERSNGKGKKSSLFFPSHHSLLALSGRSHHPPLALPACSMPPLSLRNACDRGSRCIFLTCRLLGYNSYRGVIKPSSCLKNKNGKVTDEITTALFCLAKWRGGGEGMESYRFRFGFAFFSSYIQPRSWG